MKTINIDIEQIKCEQKFGYVNSYYKVDYIKHKRKKIDGYNYNTKKSDLIYYDNTGVHQNNFIITFIYKAENGNYFRRVFNSIGETFELINEKSVLTYLNKSFSLF